MRRLLSIRHYIIASVLLLLVAAGAGGQINGFDASKRNSVAAAVEGAGLRFRGNRGQVIDAPGDSRPDSLYPAGAGGVSLCLRRNGISYVFRRWTPDSTPSHSDLLAID